MNDTLSIHIKIDNRIYPLVVERSDEEKYRNAAGRLNELIRAFRNEYPGKDGQDILAMAAYQVMVGSPAGEPDDQGGLINDLKELRDDIADFLKERP